MHTNHQMRAVDARQMKLWKSAASTGLLCTPPSLSPFVKANAYADIKIKLKALIYVCITVYV